MADRPIRLFAPHRLEPGLLLALDAAQAHYLGRVMRCRTGDRIRVFDGLTGEWSAALDVGRRGTMAVVEAIARPFVDEPGPVLALAAIRRARLEWALEKATELGIAAFQPIWTERSGGERVNLERLRAIAIEAAEQSERLTVPAIGEPMPLGPWLHARDPARPLYAALERSGAPDLLAATATHGPGDLLVGPEGGFGRADRAALAAARRVVPIGLGPRILRAETAALAGLAVLAAAGRSG